MPTGQVRIRHQIQVPSRRDRRRCIRDIRNSRVGTQDKASHRKQQQDRNTERRSSRGLSARWRLFVYPVSVSLRPFAVWLSSTCCWLLPLPASAEWRPSRLVAGRALRRQASSSNQVSSSSSKGHPASPPVT